MPTPNICQPNDNQTEKMGDVDARESRLHMRGMSDPFVAPQDKTAALAIAAIQEELDVFDDWLDRYQLIIELGRKLPVFPDLWKDDSHRVPGCQSQVWMETHFQDSRLFLAGASDAAIVSGLVALLLRVYSGRTPDEIALTDPSFLTRLGLIAALSSNRGNGVASMAEAIRRVARNAPEVQVETQVHRGLKIS